MDKELEKEEEKGWLMLAEKSLAEMWNNKEDDEIWITYLEK